LRHVSEVRDKTWVAVELAGHASKGKVASGGKQMAAPDDDEVHIACGDDQVAKPYGFCMRIRTPILYV
jgi:hypothetical protein